MRISTPVRVALGVAAAFLVAVLAVAAILIVRFQPIAREYVIEALQKRYQADVSLGKLDFSFLPRVRATGENLTLRFHGRTDVPPMVKIRRFTIGAELFGFFRSPRHIGTVVLEGLEINTPPRGQDDGFRAGAATGSTSKVSFVLDDVVADGAMLTILPAESSKAPLVFEITKLHLHSVGKDLPMTFDADLINAKPPGLIHSQGNFGPWASDQPGETALSGKYTFRDADLSVFRGIAGKLSSDGSYKGRLDDIEVQGTTDVPDFALTLGGRPMPLHTDFTATVDGTNGDTVLHPVHARLGRSVFDVSGSIERGALEHHKEIDLETKSTGGRIEDFLNLCVRAAKPAMTGAIRFNSTVKIPPGDAPVIERIRLDGAFRMAGVYFTNPDIETKIATLSHYGMGNPKDTSMSVPSDFDGHFRLEDGTIALPQLHFAVPGANVNLAGTYSITGSELDFRGHARLDAKASQMTTGWKSLLLHAVNPILSRDGAGVDLPVDITGTRQNPQFKIDFRAILKRL